MTTKKTFLIALAVGCLSLAARMPGVAHAGPIQTPHIVAASSTPFGTTWY